MIYANDLTENVTFKIAEHIIFCVKERHNRSFYYPLAQNSQAGDFPVKKSANLGLKIAARYGMNKAKKKE